MRKVVIVSVLFYTFTAALYFLSAGRMDLPFAWIYFVCNAALGLGTVAIADARSPGFAQERLKPAAGEQDRVFKPVGTICSFAVLILAGLDAGRLHWKPEVEWRTQLAGLVLDLAALLLVCRAMVENAYFSSAVRLQPDRAQVVVKSGPYVIVRHPGYTGGILYLALNALALGSWWAGLAGIPMVILTLRRTALEDAMLQKGLPGYAEYAQAVRYRLVPGVW
jgi:protein-S-isoprenylcysteine O-methyltransferase Ste14